MKKTALILLMGLLFSCSSKDKVSDNPDKELWGYSNAAIEIRYTSAKDLNLFNDYPHTIMLMVFQLEDNTDFTTLTSSNEGVSELLSSSIQTKDNPIKLKGLIKYDKFIISPDQQKIIPMDRAKNTKWIGIIAGYYNLNPDNTVRSFEIPVKSKKEGLIFKKETKYIPKLFINLNFGRSSILALEANN